MSKFRQHGYSLIRSYVALSKEIVSFIIFGIIFFQNYYKLYLIFCLVVSLMSIFYLTVKWYKETYELTEDILIITKGIFLKKVIKLPYSLIQTADITQSFLQQIFHVSQLSIDTGTMQDSEGLKICLNESEIVKIRSFILGTTTQKEHVADEVKDVSSYIYELSSQKLWLYCFSKSSFLMASIYAIVLCFLLGENFFKGLNFIVTLPIGIVISLIIFVIGIFKLGMAIKIYIGYSQYKIERQGDILHVSRGLFNKHTNSVNLTRICGLQLTQSLLQQKLKLVSVNVIALGYGTEGEIEPTLIPMISIADFDRLKTDLFSHFDCQEPSVKPSKKARLSYAIPLIMMIILVMIIPSLPKVLQVLALISIGIYGIHQYLVYKQSRLAFNQQIINVQTGGLRLVNSFIEVTQVDHLLTSQTIGQSRNKLGAFKLSYHSRSGQSCKGKGFEITQITKLQSLIEQV